MSNKDLPDKIYVHSMYSAPMTHRAVYGCDYTEYTRTSSFKEEDKLILEALKKGSHNTKWVIDEISNDSDVSQLYADKDSIQQAIQLLEARHK